MRFLHTADWQLGMTRHFLNGEAQPRYSAARRDAVAGLGALASETGAEFVVVAGDVFEHNQLAPRDVSQSLEAMRAIGIPVYLLPGNHDPLDASSVYTSQLFATERPENVIVLDRAGLHDVRPGLQLVAAPWRSKKPTSDLVGEVLDGLTADDVTRIVVGHGGVDLFEPDRDKPSLIRLAAVEQALARGAVHYVALGDKHSRTKVGSTGRVWYSGSPEVTNYDHIESDPGHVLVVEVDEQDPARAVTVDARRVGRWRFVTLRRSVDTARDVVDLDLNLDGFSDKERTVVQMALTGTLTVTDRAALDACLDRYGHKFAALNTWDRETDIAVVPADGEFDDLGIGGFAAAAVEELVLTARADGGQADDARAALALLLRLAERGECGVKLHRLVLHHYRGITHRDIVFPDRGVVVVSGANEIGKTSMIEALDLLLEAKDRSTKKEVKQVKPTHADEGTEVMAEISTGPYRFEYHKRFHKKPETRLTVLSPVREQLTGDEAHDRVQAIFADTVDTELWQAQRVLQSASTASVDLSGCDALARALDVAAGQAVALSGSEPLLIDRIDAEFRQYFTATGKATGQWSAAVSRLRDAEARVALCQDDVDEVDEAVVRHSRLVDELARVSLDRSAGVQLLATAHAAAASVTTLTDRLAHARALGTGAEMAMVASTSALTERRRLRAELDERRAAITELESALVAAADDEAAAGEVAVAAVDALETARAIADDGQTRVDAARRIVDRIARRDEARRLTTQLAKIDAVDRELLGVREELARITLSDEVMRDVERAALAIERAAAQTELVSARVEVEGLADVRLIVAGQPVDLSPGLAWSQNVTTSTDVEVPGLLTLRVVPGAPAADSQAKLDRAREMLAVVLAEAGVVDVEAARALDARKREVTSVCDRLRATRDALVGDDALDALRARLAALCDAPAGDPGADPTADVARAALEAASAAHRQARTEHDEQRGVAAAVGARAAQAAAAAAVLRSKLSTAQVELASGAERLAHQRESTTDEQLAIQAEADRERAGVLAAQVLAIDAELAAAGPAAVSAELADATRRAAELGERHDDVQGRLREVTAQLSVYGAQGRQGRLDAALTEREHATTEHARVQRRAGAAQLLQSVMSRHRDESRLRYVDPFRAEVERLGRIVFGDDFEVEIDGDLRMCSRTLAGRTVPYESLSGGAREQLGIVARLASAALVAKEDGVPVVIDDALGFSDAGRLAKMGEVFEAVGGDGQVIVLTCSPERYASIGGAQHIELSI